MFHIMHLSVVTYYELRILHFLCPYNYDICLRVHCKEQEQLCDALSSLRRGEQILRTKKESLDQQRKFRPHHRFKFHFGSEVGMESVDLFPPKLLVDLTSYQFCFGLLGNQAQLLQYVLSSVFVGLWDTPHFPASDMPSTKRCILLTPSIYHFGSFLVVPCSFFCSNILEGNASSEVCALCLAQIRGLNSIL